jgi:chromosome segregation ATPase
VSQSLSEEIQTMVWGFDHKEHKDRVRQVSQGVAALEAERDALAAQLAAALEALEAVQADVAFVTAPYSGLVEDVLSSPATAAEAYTERARSEERVKYGAEVRRATRAEEREACAKVAQSEPELPGEPGEGLLQAMRENPEDAARAVVRVTKHSIAAAILARGKP